MAKQKHKYEVGQRVRVTSPGLQLPVGASFDVTEIRWGGKVTEKKPWGPYFYTGEVDQPGLTTKRKVDFWENFLAPVTLPMDSETA